MAPNIAEEINALFSEHADPERAEGMKAYMKGQFEYYGINSPLRKELLRAFFKANGSPQDELTDLVRELWLYDQREMQYVATDLIRRHIRKQPASFIQVIESLILKKSWWDTVDHLSVNAGTLMQKHPDLQPAVTDSWIRSDSMWLRRAAVIHQLMYKGSTNWTMLQDYILRVAHEEEFFIRKACGWALRQYSKTSPQQVAAFIDQYRDQLSGLTIREGSKYI
ncbi:MAG: DNA alkylation repair protein [Saprospiraceae bacterium]|nr:DNA alkylation repair protein [Saprospiraceae bacterium]